MLPAQACAKWPPCLLIRAHDGSRRRPNITAPFDRWCRYKVSAVRDFIRKPGCVGQICLGLKWKAQRSHVTFMRSTILLTFLFGEGPERLVVPVNPRQGETPSPLTLLVDSSGSAMCSPRCPIWECLAFRLVKVKMETIKNVNEGWFPARLHIFVGTFVNVWCKFEVHNSLSI